MCDSLTLEMLALALVLIKTKNAIFLTNWSENAHFTWEFRVFDDWREFSIEKGQFLPMGQKDFLFWTTPEPMETFLGLKNHSSP